MNDKTVSAERLTLAEEIIKRWAQWIVHVSADMEEPEWSTASANSVENDRDFVLSVLSASRTSPVEPGQDQVSIERLKEMAYNSSLNPYDSDETKAFRELLDIRLRAASIPTQPVVKVKPLEWHDLDGTHRIASVSQTNVCNVKYEIYMHQSRFEPVWAGSMGVDFPTLEEAKAAAQADYEQRIRSALTPASTNGGEVNAAWLQGYEKGQQVPGEVTDEMVERAKAALKENTKSGTHHSDRNIRIILTAALKAGE